jgi:hypothetical protein
VVMDMRLVGRRVDVIADVHSRVASSSIA